MEKDLLIKIQNIPLVKTIDLHEISGGGSLFFGIGLMTSQQLGTGLPFDILGIFFASELVRRVLNLQSTIILLADTHAKSNQLFPNEAIDNLAAKIEKQLQQIVRNFALKNFQLIRASTFQSEPEFQKLLESLPPMTNRYLRLEVADCLWLRQKHNLQIKVGWTMAKISRIEGNDERFFDMTIKELVPKLGFIHLEPGWTFDPNRPRVSPYISIEGEKRLILNRAQKTTDLGQCQSHLAKIVRCAETLWGKLPQKTLEEKAQFILDKAVA